MDCLIPVGLQDRQRNLACYGKDMVWCGCKGREKGSVPMIEYGDRAGDSVWPGGLNLCQAEPVPGKALGMG